jgi:RNA polymerase sigma-70 factor (ECF subfamily)
MACVQGRERFRRDSSFRTYLFATARNVLYSEYRRRRRKDAPIDFGTVSAVDINPSPSQVLVDKREQRLLLEALRTIPIDFQVALELFLWEDLTGPQMAEILDLKEPGVRSRLRRAKETLRKRMLELSAGGERLDSTETDLEDWARGLREELGRTP